MKNLKHFFSFLLMMSMLLALNITVSAAEFTDVPEDAAYTGQSAGQRTEAISMAMVTGALAQMTV